MDPSAISTKVKANLHAAVCPGDVDRRRHPQCLVQRSRLLPELRSAESWGDDGVRSDSFECGVQSVRSSDLADVVLVRASAAASDADDVFFVGHVPSRCSATRNAQEFARTSSCSTGSSDAVDHADDDHSLRSVNVAFRIVQHSTFSRSESAVDANSSVGIIVDRHLGGSDQLHVELLHALFDESSVSSRIMVLLQKTDFQQSNLS